jgi:hypothetical protein
MSATIPGMLAAPIVGAPEVTPLWIVVLIEKRNEGVEGAIIRALPPCRYSEASFHADNWRLEAMRAIDRAEVCLLPSTPRRR